MFVVRRTTNGFFPGPDFNDFQFELEPMFVTECQTLQGHGTHAAEVIGK